MELGTPNKASFAAHPYRALSPSALKGLAGGEARADTASLHPKRAAITARSAAKRAVEGERDNPWGA